MPGRALPTALLLLAARERGQPLTTRSLRIALVMGAVLGMAACDRHQGSPSAPRPPTPTVTVSSLTISGNASISDPGGTTQLTATARYSDDSTRNVTADIQWRSSDSDPLTAVVSVISPGLIRAERYGQGAVRATYASERGALSADATVRVAPDGVFLIDVMVADHGYATDGARVQLTSPAGTFRATTNLWGYVILPAAGDAIVQVEKAGFRTIAKAMTVTSDRDIEFVLQPSDGGVTGQQ